MWSEKVSKVMDKTVDLEHSFEVSMHCRIKAIQKLCFVGYAPKRDNINKPSATKIKNITPMVNSECFLKVEGSGNFSE